MNARIREYLFFLYARLKEYFKNYIPKKKKRKANHLILGEWGEKIARKYLKRKRYKIITKNWTNHPHELDIIAYKDKTLVFVEVKLRRTTSQQSGIHVVNKEKKRRLACACRAYLRQLKHKPKYHRFDVIDISYASKEDYKIGHFENVPLFRD